MGWPKGKPRKPPESDQGMAPKLAVTQWPSASGSIPSLSTDDTTDPGDSLPSSIQFGAVMLEFEMPKRTTAGQAWSQTARFSVEGGYEVRLEGSLVYITHEKGGACIIPIGRVKFFEPLSKPAAA